ncbi:MAG: hypothetical protein LBR15_00830 [Methanobrevibacter sp.]|nr:hypothetical protein [Candidatus Methanovirga australis]
MFNRFKNFFRKKEEEITFPNFIEEPIKQPHNNFGGIREDDEELLKQLENIVEQDDYADKGIRKPPQYGEKEWDPCKIIVQDEDNKSQYSTLNEQDIEDYYHLIPRLKDIINDYSISNYMFFYEINYFLQRRSKQSLGAMIYLLGIFNIDRIFNQHIAIYHDRILEVLEIGMNKMKNEFLINIGYIPDTNQENVKKYREIVDRLHKRLNLHPSIIEAYKKSNSFCYYQLQIEPIPVVYRTHFMICPMSNSVLSFEDKYEPINDRIRFYKDMAILDTFVEDQKFLAYDQDNRLKFIMLTLNDLFNKTLIPYLRPHILLNECNNKLSQKEEKRINDGLMFLRVYVRKKYEYMYVSIMFYLAIWYRCVLERLSSYGAVCEYLGLSYFIWNNTIGVNKKVFYKQWSGEEYISMEDNKRLKTLFHYMHVIYVQPDINSINKWKKTVGYNIDEDDWVFIQIPPLYLINFNFIDLLYLWREHFNLGDYLKNHEYDETTCGIWSRMVIVEETKIEPEKHELYQPCQILFYNPKIQKDFTKINYCSMHSDEIEIDGLNNEQQRIFEHWLHFKKKVNTFDELIKKYGNIDNCIENYIKEEWNGSKEIKKDRVKEFLIIKWRLNEQEIKEKSMETPKGNKKKKIEDLIGFQKIIGPDGQEIKKENKNDAVINAENDSDEEKPNQEEEEKKEQPKKKKKK